MDILAFGTAEKSNENNKILCEQIGLLNIDTDMNMIRESPCHKLIYLFLDESFIAIEGKIILENFNFTFTCPYHTTSHVCSMN